MVLLIIIPFLNGYFIGNIPNIFRQTHLSVFLSPFPFQFCLPISSQGMFSFQWFGSHLIGAACAVAAHSLRPPRLECIWCLDQSFGMRCACTLHMQHICFVHSMYIYILYIYSYIHIFIYSYVYIYICLIYVCVTSMCNDTLSSVAASGTMDGILGSGRRRHRTRAPLRGSPPNGKGSYWPLQCWSETRRYNIFQIDINKLYIDIPSGDIKQIDMFNIDINKLYTLWWTNMLPWKDPPF